MFVSKATWNEPVLTVLSIIIYVKCANVLFLLSDKADTVPGYDFLVNSVWPEITRAIEERLSYLFNPGNPDIFYEVLHSLSDTASCVRSLWKKGLHNVCVHSSTALSSSATVWPWSLCEGLSVSAARRPAWRDWEFILRTPASATSGTCPSTFNYGA